MQADSNISQQKIQPATLAVAACAAPAASASWRDTWAGLFARVLPRFSLHAASLEPLVLLILALHLFLWTLLTGIFHSAPDVDNMEELIWGNVFQLGYYKHPPLPSWVHYALISVLGRHAWITFFAGQLSVTLAFYFVWRLGCELTSQRNALLALLLMMPIAYFTTRGVMSNHNTIQLWSVAGAIWMFYRAWRHHRLRDWLLLGMFSAFAMLTKYSAGIWFLMFALQLLISGQLRQPRVWLGILAGTAAMALILMPHALWLYNLIFVARNGTNPLSYAGNAADIGWITRSQNLLAIYYVITTSLARIAPMLGAMLIIAGLTWRAARKHPDEADAAKAAPTIAQTLRPCDRAFLLLMSLAPLVISCTAAFIAKAWIIADWTTTFFLMTGFLTFWLYRNSPSLRLLKTTLVVIGVIQILTVTGYALGRGPLPSLLGRPSRSNYPSGPVSQAMQAVWREHVDSPLRFISADNWTGGNIAIHAGRQAQVIINGDLHDTPWIDPAQVKACGMLVAIDASSFTSDPVRPMVAELMKQTQWQGTVSLPATYNAHGPQVVVHWGIIAPAGGCQTALKPRP